MHEMALCESVLQVIEQEAARHGFQQVRVVRLEIGAMAGVEVEAMRFGWGVVSRESVAEGAELVILETPGRGWCLECSREVEVARRYDPCVHCGGYQLQVTGGDELKIKDLEVD